MSPTEAASDAPSPEPAPDNQCTSPRPSTSRTFPLFRPLPMSVDEAWRIWGEFLLKAVVDDDFEDLIFSTASEENSAVYLTAIHKAEGMVCGARDSMISSFAWSAGFRSLLQQMPSWKDCPAPFACEAATCMACARAGHRATHRVRLGSLPSDKLAPWYALRGAGGVVDGSAPNMAAGLQAVADEVVVLGPQCYDRSRAYHELTHLKRRALSLLRRRVAPLLREGAAPASIVRRLLRPAGNDVIEELAAAASEVVDRANVWCGAEERGLRMRGGARRSTGPGRQVCSTPSPLTRPLAGAGGGLDGCHGGDGGLPEDASDDGSASDESLLNFIV